MSLAVLFVALLVAGATLPLLREALRGRGAGTRRALALTWAVGSLALGVLARDAAPSWSERTALERPALAPADGYVSSDTCRACHPSEWDSWHDTYHRTMAQLAVDGNVLAPFDGRALSADLGAEQGRTPRVVPYRQGDEFWVELEDPYHEGPGPAPLVRRRVVQTTGSHHQQLYWFATGHTRALGLLPWGYRMDEERWLPIDALFLTPPRGVQSRILGRWNSSCSKCHATHGKPRFDGPQVMDTTATELGISCEMCHGPAAEHVAVNQNPLRRWSLHDAASADSASADATIVDPADLDPVRSTQVCGQCHGVTYLPTPELRQRWIHEGFSYRPGDDLLETRGLGEPDADAADRKYWDDGQMRVTGREYTALQRTPCFRAEAMTCLSCHRLHRAPDDPRPLEEWRNDLLAPGMDGDRACTQCHEEYTEPAALAAHSHHAPDSTGSRCLDCHMPYTAYGLMGAIRSHDVEPPTVQASLATGRPTSCNQCHIDRTLAWTAHWLEQWYGTEPPELDPAQSELAASVLWTLQGDAGQRALMAWSLGWGPAVAIGGGDWRLPYLALLMNDPYHVVRFIAGRSARTVAGSSHLEYDHLAPNDERLGVTSALLEDWAASQGPDADARPALLIGAGGAWDEARVQELLRGRDNSDVVLQE